jgi:hypothetical protein
VFSQVLNLRGNSSGVAAGADMSVLDNQLFSGLFVGFDRSDGHCAHGIDLVFKSWKSNLFVLAWQSSMRD